MHLHHKPIRYIYIYIYIYRLVPVSVPTFAFSLSSNWRKQKGSTTISYWFPVVLSVVLDDILDSIRRLLSPTNLENTAESLLFVPLRKIVNNVVHAVANACFMVDVMLLSAFSSLSFLLFVQPSAPTPQPTQKYRKPCVQIVQCSVQELHANFVMSELRTCQLVARSQPSRTSDISNLYISITIKHTFIPVVLYPLTVLTVTHCLKHDEGSLRAKIHNHWGVDFSLNYFCI